MSDTSSSSDDNFTLGTKKVSNILKKFNKTREIAAKVAKRDRKTRRGRSTTSKLSTCSDDYSDLSDDRELLKLKKPCKLATSSDESSSENRPLSNLKKPRYKKVLNCPKIVNCDTTDTSSEPTEILPKVQLQLHTIGGIASTSNDAPNLPSLQDSDNILDRLDRLAQECKDLSAECASALNGKRKGRRAGKQKHYESCNCLMCLFVSIGTMPQRRRRGRPRRAAQRKNTNQSTIIIDSEEESAVVLNDEQCEIIESPKIDNSSVQCKVIWRLTTKEQFKVKRFQSLSCIRDYFIREFNVNPLLILFTVNDREVELHNHCYVSLKLNDSIIIEGGVLPDEYLTGKERPRPPEVANTKGTLRLRVQYQDGPRTKDFPMQLKCDDSFEMAFWLISRELPVLVENINLFCDGSPIASTDTVDSLELEEDDCLDLVIRQ